ncbi:hypothetical protein G6O69_37575 [Pseudenhygromyxa sp. WMMC2535]|uniref:hypothetical protein n=1 Tax=Pseudenhygromyxa sp. WMMC2535 TaxID=2712867 RepID=UPI001551A991|nr:hypothetical protein [Pseudenhygromyxa sp. WMMC2535]NVB38201.1 hypothetical protein [Pseudenhygromyxa sp. WMMC2535]NVB43582.1 hypothetical protein [Pseudenhygromyxa sp. WMMC2535]
MIAPMLISGCRSAPPAEVSDRLWVSQLPTSPRDRVDAFVVTEVGKRAGGSFYHGSVYRGAHDSFLWTGKGKSSGVIYILQDQREYPVETKSCTPDRGFDLCIELEGDPKKIVRYQSRKRWAIPRRGSVEALDIPGVVRELAEDDEELEALFIEP